MPRINFGTWSVGRLAVITVCFPLFGFIFCLFYSFVYHFDKTTYTHCEVPNFSPSISAAIGSFAPQKYVWQTAIALHIGPRFFFVDLYRRYFQNKCDFSKTKIIRRVIVTVHILSVIENASLLGLTIVSSADIFAIHKFCFGAFITSSFLYMLLVSYVLFNPRLSGYNSQGRNDRISLLFKRRIFKAQFLSIPLLLYFYYRHNSFCEPYVYSFFCITEYFIVLSNMGFHMTAFYDFKGTVLMTSTLNSAGYGILPDMSNA
ncbi:post-GPI attachment to proteins factor 2-like [Lepeophtheirus salmonis]|uniref:post-GPI attachment to proteins factor 2-like n=1 Tax=Lepeophtheirus salmonis TaxID=72036 RepID=UPI001AE3DF9F|nr:post-GPI attachment to proteins factor 2-like [Lepeophtheirus salmonis]